MNLFINLEVVQGSGLAESWMDCGRGLMELLGTTRTGNQDSQVVVRVAWSWVGVHQENGMIELATTQM